MRVFYVLLFCSLPAFASVGGQSCGSRAAGKFNDITAVVVAMNLNNLPNQRQHKCIEGAYLLQAGKITNQDWELLVRDFKCGF